ncbi:UPF0669 protein C6orf120 homolog [Mercenaria mercenaria]|uniref:UPF0669 protein C6orf120 homolog n=1 Tax=Mercenaria mercenaria TaxID=6596 RepID=UPI001E1D9E72|nr:UPF0669 protein C6orf120 homolog [Mercenaria mercenaria]
MMFTSVSLSVPALLVLLFNCCKGQELLQSLKGTIGAENYTYYRLSRVGRLRVELVSLSGDADLYVSDTTLNPAYDKYTAQSITCGKDVIEVPASYNRPVGIAVYGYPGHEISEYLISIYQLPKNEEMDYEQLKHMFHDYEAADYLFKNYEASHYMYRDVKPNVNPQGKSSSSGQDALDEDEAESFGSVLWEILLTLLKVVFEVIL